MRIKLVLPTLLSLALYGCSAEERMPPSVEAEIEKALGMDVYIPQDSRYPITFAELRYPPQLQEKPVGSRYSAFISYSKTKGNQIEITADQKKQLELQGHRKFLYGEFEGEHLIRCEISNSHTSMANASLMKLEGVPVEYNKIEREKQKYLFVVFNWKQGSYSFDFTLKDNFTEKDGFRFTQDVIRALAAHETK